MGNMLTLEEIIKRIAQRKEPHWLAIMALGGLALLFPPLAFGYLLRYGRQVRKSRNVELPDKGDISQCISDGLPVTVLAVLTLYLPLWIGTLLGWPLSYVGLGWLPVWFTMLVGSAAFTAFFYVYLSRKTLEVINRADVVIGMLKATLQKVWLPSLLFCLVNYLGWWIGSSIGFNGLGVPFAAAILLLAHFFSLTVLLAHNILVFRVLEKEGSAAFNPKR